MTTTNCIFCKIIAKEIPSDTIYEDDDVAIFRDIHPKAPTHLLIVPKTHIESILTLDESTKDVPSMLIWKAKKFAEEKELLGYQLKFHVGREGGQEVDHIHLHLMANKEV